MEKIEKILELKSLSVGYSARGRYAEIMGDISVSASRGEMIAVIGANGVGKSTLLRSIIRLQAPLKGEIAIKGKNISDYSQSELASYFSFVSASASVSGNLTVNELVALGRFPHTNWIGRVKDLDREKIDFSISSVGLTRFINRKLSEMSDGERQRAMIARALAQDTQFIVLDEPTAYLDLPNKYELIALLREIVEREGKTVIYTTHDLHIAIGESDKIWLLGKNDLFEGSPEDLMREGRFAQLFHESKLEFADESGLYIYPSKTIGKISIDASQKLEKLTRRAIIRLKIEIGSDPDLPLLKVRGDYKKAEWIIFVDSKETARFTDIYTLSNYLKKDLFSDYAFGNH